MFFFLSSKEYHEWMTENLHRHPAPYYIIYKTAFAAFAVEKVMKVFIFKTIIMYSKSSNGCAC